MQQALVEYCPRKAFTLLRPGGVLEWLSILDVDTPQKVLDELGRLSKKEWFTRQHLKEFLEVRDRARRTDPSLFRRQHTKK